MLQLNIYCYLLEMYYQISVSRMVLASFHPNLERTFVLEVPRLSIEIGRIIDDLRNKL
jgi:hypothetical protein